MILLLITIDHCLFSHSFFSQIATVSAKVLRTVMISKKELHLHEIINLFKDGFLVLDRIYIDVCVCMWAWVYLYMCMDAFKWLQAHCTYSVCMCFTCVWVSGCLCACPYAVTSAVTKETPWGGKEVPKGVRHGEERHVVHSLSLEKSLSEIHRLIQSASPVREMSSSSLRVTAWWTLPLRRWGEVSL